MTTDALGTLGIVELGEVCDRHIVANRGWFETLGAWVGDEPAGDRQRLWATAAHRHAWHLDLWRGRRPTIPPVHDRPRPDSRTETATVATVARADTPIDGRAGTYRSALADLLAALDDLTATIDAELDPSTARVIDLVRSDMVELLDLLDLLDPTGQLHPPVRWEAP